jgi:hypothetical protein
MTLRLPTLCLTLLLAAGCKAGDAEQAPAPARPGAAAPVATGWSANPTSAVTVTRSADTLRVETGPHAILWPADAAELAPPYRVSATFRKQSGRLHEGYGLIFGASGLEGPEGGQVYSYFLVRGDGSFLVKRRQGSETPVVRDWTQHPVIRRDQDESGQPNQLEVRVTGTDAAFLVNGTEVARVPAAELSLRGRGGVRTSHELELAVSGFTAGAGAQP